MRIASMTKPITGVALMMLLEEGKWSLDDPVAKHIPEFANLQVLAADGTRVPQATPMTMRQLVSHSAGFAYGLSLGSPVDAMYREQRVLDRGTSLDEMIRKLAALPLAFQPGERWYYSAAVDVQGYLVQKLSGMPFDAFLRTRLFGPLKMADTDFALTPVQLPRLASIHTHDAEGRLVAAPPVGAGGLLGDPTQRPGLPSGGGGLFSTTHDYYRFCQMLLQGGELDGVRILQPATVALLHANQLPPGVTVGGGISRAFADLQFGVDVAIVTPAAAAAMGQPAGSYFWGGAFGTWFWIDPANGIVALFMVQYRPSAPTALASQAAGRTDVRGEIARLVYEALPPK
jgi:CubicO group peptidase (beta-lactamase class C family)